MSLEGDFFQTETISCDNSTFLERQSGGEFQDYAIYAYQCSSSTERREQLTWLHLIVIGAPFALAVILYVLTCVLPLLSRRMDVSRLLRVGLPRLPGFPVQPAVGKRGTFGPYRPELSFRARHSLMTAYRRVADARLRPAPPFAHWAERSWELAPASQPERRADSRKRAMLRMVQDLARQAGSRGQEMRLEAESAVARLLSAREWARRALRAEADTWGGGAVAEELVARALMQAWRRQRGDGEGGLLEGGGGKSVLLRAEKVLKEEEGEANGVAVEDLDRRLREAVAAAGDAAVLVSIAAKQDSETLRSYVARLWKFGRAKSIPVTATVSVSETLFADLIEDAAFGPWPWSSETCTAFSRGLLFVSAATNKALDLAGKAVEHAVKVAAVPQRMRSLDHNTQDTDSPVVRVDPDTLFAPSASNSTASPRKTALHSSNAKPPPPGRSPFEKIKRSFRNIRSSSPYSNIADKERRDSTSNTPHKSGHSDEDDDTDDDGLAVDGDIAIQLPLDATLGAGALMLSPDDRRIGKVRGTFDQEEEEDEEEEPDDDDFDEKDDDERRPSSTQPFASFGSASAQWQSIY